MSLLESRRALVTGVGDLGIAIAETLRDHGATVDVWDVDRDALARAEEAGLATAEVNLTDREQVEHAAARTAERLGGIDILVNTAAVATFGPVVALDPEQWQRTIDVNLTGVFLTCRSIVPYMVEQGRGSVVNLSSIGGLKGEPEFSDYCTTKFGIIGFTQSLALEVGGDGVRVNALCPGAVESSMNTDVMLRDARRFEITVDEVEQMIVDQTALKRLGTPEDIANAALFLCSDLSSYVTGESLAVTGGLL